MLALLSKQMIPEEDRVIFLGDYIDRGPDSRGVVEQLLKFSKQQSCVFLKGNHDARFLPWREKKSTLLTGGIHTINSYKKDGRIEVPPDHLEFFNGHAIQTHRRKQYSRY